MKKLLALFVLLWASGAYAQFTTTPNLGLQKPNNGVTSSWDTYLNGDLNLLDALVGGPVRDATTQTGADACAKISQAAISINTASGGYGGIVDARGFQGTQTCAGSMFSPWPAGNPPITILLGPANFVVSVGQNPPSHAQIIGSLSWGLNAPTFTAQGTVIQVSSTFPTSTAVVSVGNGAVASGVKISNVRITCVPPTGSNPTGCIPYQNDWGQEGTSLDEVILDGGTDTGFEMSSVQAQQAGPFTRIIIGMNGVNSATATCMRLGAAGSLAILNSAFINVSCGGTSNGTEPTNLITVDAANVSFEALHMEQGVNGMVLGSTHATHGVSVRVTQCSGSAGKPMTTCVSLSNANSVDGFVANSIYALTGQNVTNVLADAGTNGRTIADSSQQALAEYTREINGVVTSSTDLVSAGTVAISSSTTGVHNFTQAYGSAPVCTVTPTSDPTATGVYWVTPATGSITVTVKVSGTITFDYRCVPTTN